MKYIYKFKVRFSDTDAYGIVHHSNFFNYFEEARLWFSAEHLGFNEVIANHSTIKFPVIESECHYKKPLMFSLDYYVIELEFERHGSSKLEFNFTIKSNDQKTDLAFGKTVHVLVNEQNKLCIDLPKWLDDKINQLDNE